MGVNLMRHHFPGKKRCDLCHKPKDFLYPITLDGVTVWVCCGAHADIATRNWQEKKKLGIKPGIQRAEPIDIEQAEADNINDLE